MKARIEKQIIEEKETEILVVTPETEDDNTLLKTNVFEHKAGNSVMIPVRELIMMITGH